MKKSLLIWIGVAVVLFFAFWIWFWSLGSVSASEEVPAIRVEATSGVVERQVAGDLEWKKVEASTPIQKGDHIRTGTDGKAEIRWGLQGVTRIDPSSELEIEEMPADSMELTQASIKLHQISGRSWSRLLKLLDVESEAEVRTNTVIATVRGTAFGVAVAGDGLETAVSDSVVDIHADGGASTLVREGKWGRFSATGTPEILREYTDADAWPTDNARLDREFDDALRNELVERSKKLDNAGSDLLSRISESLHLAFASDEEKNQTATNYALREASRTTPDGERIQKLLGNSSSSLNGFLLGLRELTARDPSRRDIYRTLRARALEQRVAGKLYAQALDLDDDIDDWRWTPAGETRETQRQLLDQRVTTWVGMVRNASELSEETMRKLVAKGDAMHERLRADVLMQLPEPLPEIATSTEPEAPTSTVSTTGATVKPVTKPVAKPTTAPVKATTTTQTAPPPTTTGQVNCSIQRTQLYIGSTLVKVGEKVYLALYGICPDGTTKNLTLYATFNAGLVTDGTMSGNVFVPSHAGTITLYGNYLEAGKTLTAQGSITVSAEPKHVTSVTVIAVGPTTITTGQSVPLDAKANYSDGTSSYIKYQCQWSTSDPRMAMISNSTFQHLQGTGQVSAICAYTENNVTVSGSLVFTINQDSSLTPTNGTSPNRTYYLNNALY
jgi:hypothetical protein